MEPLEDRLLLSTTIAYTPTSINIVGDTARTGQINVSGTAGNPYAVTVAGETPVVKGTPPLVSSGVSITVSTGNAGRTVNVTPANARNITVNGGTGNDTITVGSVASNVFSGNIAINGGSGTNNLAVSFVDIAGNVTIKGGTGADTVNVGAGGSISGSTTINTGDGANGVTLDSVTIRGKWTINGGKDVDTVTLGTGGTTRLLGNGSINTKAGNDRIFFNKGTYGSRPPITTTTVSAGDGDDDIRIAGATVAGAVVFAGNFKLDAGTGNDTLKIAASLFANSGVDFERNATILMGAGNDDVMLASMDDSNYVLFMGTTTLDFGASLTSGNGDRLGVSVGATSSLTLNGSKNTINFGSGIKDLIIQDGIRAGSIHLGTGTRTEIKAAAGASVSTNLKSKLLAGLVATADNIHYLISIL